MCGRACRAIAWARRMMAARPRADGMTCGALFAGRDNADGLVLSEARHQWEGALRLWFECSRPISVAVIAVSSFFSARRSAFSTTHRRTDCRLVSRPDRGSRGRVQHILTVVSSALQMADMPRAF
jgi:hypothetical protein